MSGARNVLALALALCATPGTADPLTDLLNRIFRPAPGPVVNYRPTTAAKRPAAPVSRLAGASSMVASYYGAGERLNAYTASGERFRPGGFTAAHRTLPMGARLHVCHRGCVVVRINDRGPAAWTGRSLDLARGAAAAIGMTDEGVARVGVTVLGSRE